MFRAPPPDAAAAAAFAAASAGAHTHDDLKDDLLLLACLALSFAAAWTLVLDRLLLVSASSIDAATRFLFSLTFATSCSLLLLVVLEVGDSFPESKVSAEDIVRAEHRLQQTIESILDKKRRLMIAQSVPRDGLWSEPAATRGMFGGVFSSVAQRLTGGGRTDEVDRQRLIEAKTWRGIYNNALGYAFSGYCLYKMAAAAVGILFSRTGGTDPVTQALEILVHNVGLDIDVETWTKELSFIFLGVLVAASIRGLLLQLAKVSAIFSSAASQKSMVLLLAHIMGFYFLSVVLMMRANLPAKQRANLTLVLGAVEFDFYQRWFDAIFLVSATASGIAIAVAEHIKRSSRAWIDD
ncbi:hypothetical protein HK105_206912 [Polyrhizophydium stewartii]|uniref:Abscisic acid G-protein coupled receptor-like domain-containing protein n=1 Tax=Polyrhizophydium stewartii TaxID=2732419 RepID=A0ABR4N273_9FUNG